MCFSVPFLQVERHHKAIVSMAYVVTPCVWKDTFSSVIHKVVCWQKLRCAGGCEDGADPGRLTPLRLVLSGRQPVLWFDDSECDFRMEDWLYGSYKCSFTISSSREGSAHSFDALKFVDLLMIFSWYSLLFSCTRTPTGTIMAHHLCFPGSACFCLCSVLPNRTALIWLQEGFQCCIRYSVNTWFYAINPSIVWKGDSGEFKNMTTSCGCVVLFGCHYNCSRVSNGQKWVEVLWADWAEFLGVNFNIELICNGEVETRNGPIATYDIYVRK